MPKMMIAVLALGTTTMATGTMAFVRGGGGGEHFGGGSGGHFGGGGRFGGSFGRGHFGNDRVCRRFPWRSLRQRLLGAALAACTGSAAHRPITATATAAVMPSRPTHG